MTDEKHTEYLQTAYEALRRVQLTLEDGPAEEGLSAVIRDLETAMSDHFDMAIGT